MQKDVSCPFCNIKAVRPQMIFECYHFYVVNCLGPIVPGHRLIIPYRHIRDISEVNGTEWQFLHSAMKWTVAQNFKDFNKDSFSFINAPSGQSVYHLHWHFVPNFFGIHGFDIAIRNGLNPTQKKRKK